MSSSSSDPPDSDAISSPEPVKLGKHKNKRSESPEPSRPGKRKHKHSSGDTSTNDLINSISSGSHKKTTRKHEDSKMDDAELYQNTGRKASSLLDTFGVPTAGFQDWSYIRLRCHSDGDYVVKGMSKGRSADLNSVKHKGLQYVSLNMYSKEHALDPLIPEVEDNTMAAMQAGEITMTVHNWPMFFYEDSIYDAANKTKAINKYIIAYIHVITYFTISSTQHWTWYIGDMDLDELLWAIIEMLDDNDDPWVKDTLTWWNRHLKPIKDNSHFSQAHAKGKCIYNAVPSHLVNPNKTQEVASAPALQSITMKRISHIHPNEFDKQLRTLIHHIPKRPTLGTILQFIMMRKLQCHHQSKPILDQMGNSAIMVYFFQMMKKMNWYQLETQPTAQNPMLMNSAGPIPMSHCHQSSNLGIPLRLLATMQLMLQSEQALQILMERNHDLGQASNTILQVPLFTMKMRTSLHIQS
ncbi:hypothetical protein F4604DRAFT_1691499 [Suillus subluteus]|nr:hypothetical protein F4604DRAFT_1691499 [Suillus subluteus]